MSEEVDINKKDENETENKEEEHKKKRKKKKKKTGKVEEKTEKEEDDKSGYNKDIIRDNNPIENNDEDIKQLNEEALSNIPSKEVPKKKKNKKKTITKENNEIEEPKENNEKKEKEKEKEMDINEILNNNNENNNGDLMLTELLDIDGNKKKKKKKKKKEKDEQENEQQENENIKELINDENEDIVNEENKELDKQNLFLKDKLNNLDVIKSLKEGVSQGIIKSNEELHEDLKNNKIYISKKVISNSELIALNKSLENKISGNSRVFLTDVDKFMTKENIKNLRFLQKEEENLKKNIAKLDQNQKLIESSMPLKSNVIESNIRKSKLKDISKTKDEFILRLEKINQKIDILLNDEKLRQKNLRQNLTEIIAEEDEEEKFNLHLKEMQKKENKIREKYEEDLLKAKNKRNMEFDKKEKNIKELKKKLFNEAREKEKKLFLKRKNEINGQLEKTKKFINEKVQKTDKDYLFYRYQEDFEKKEKKLIDKINMTKKEPLVTQEQLKELAEKINQQKKYLQDNADEKKKQMQKLWTYRSQTLPTYRHPLTVKAEEEKIKKLNDEEEEKKKKECNQLEKINYKPPSVKINKKLKQIREKRINPNSKEMLLETELNNKKRINEMRFTPIHSNKNPIIKDERSIELNNNNFINLIEVKNSLTKKSKKKLKPIQILHPKPDKPIDYLKEMKEKRNKSSEEEKKKSINFDDLFKPEQKNENILESLEVAKIRTNTIDKKIERKKEIMNVNGGYLKNPNLAGEIGDLLVESIQAKLQLVNKLGGEEES